MGRRSFNIEISDKFAFDVARELFGLSDCYRLAEISNQPADIYDSVLKTRDGRFIRLTVVSEDGNTEAYGVRKGWYSAYATKPEDAIKTRQSWALLREQRPEPQGPLK